MLDQLSITTPQTLAQILKAYRLQKNMTQKDISSLIGVRQATVSLFERHPEKVTIETLFKIMSVLNIQINLSDRMDPKNKTWDGGW